MRGLITIEKLRPDGYEYPVGLGVAIPGSPAANLANIIVGGTQTIDGDNAVHTYTTSGFFDNQHTSNVEVEFLVIGGGGGSGSSAGGGGGAGGLVYGSGYNVEASANLIVTVGSGGSGYANGVNSSIEVTSGPPSSNVISLGGGKGARYAGTDLYGFGGGSGGGGGGYYSGRAVVGGLSLQSPSGGGTGYGNPGGNGYALGPIYGAGGGGGANTAGGNGVSSRGGLGGPGLSYSISGSSVTYAGGGGGGGGPGSGVAPGGTGGGGSGCFASGGTTGASGTANRGGGGGGNAYETGTAVNGGSGVIFIRYVKDAEAGIPTYSIN